jgi:hypothetical protein
MDLAELLDATGLGPWLGLAALGAFHGINPAMGWLFAVALGLQEGRRAAVLQALPLIALGHEGSLLVTTALVSGLRLVAAPDVLRVGCAVGLVLFGAYKLLRPRAHGRWARLRVRPRELAVWSFLMSSAHGAGLMLFPFLLALPGRATHPHLQDLLADVSLIASAAALVVHTGAMLLVMGAVALLVYDQLGLSVLRRAWLNLDLVWSVAIIMGGLLTLLA